MEEQSQEPKTREDDESIVNSGYRAQAQGKSMTKDNPYISSDPRHFQWRKGFLQAHMDSN